MTFDPEPPTFQDGQLRI